VERSWRLAKEESLRLEFATWNGRLKEHGFNATIGQPMTDSAIAAVEAYALHDLDQSLKAIQLFKVADQGAATLALMRQAVASQFAKVRRSAAQALAERNPDHYLTKLLEFARPMPSGRTFALGVGEIWYWQDGRAMTVAMSRPSPRPFNANGDRWIFTPSSSGPASIDGRHAEAEFVRSNAVSALQAVTGKKLGDDYSAWRKVVAEITDLYLDSSTPQPTSLSRTYFDPMTLSTGEAWVYSPPRGLAVGFGFGSCFAAGTPVVTKRGVVPIDQVCIGELVLSRNVETDETSYKPVLARTLRPRVPMRRLSVGDELLLATAGHPFWTKDKGWTKAKNLSQGLSLGGEDGEVKLSSVADAEEPQQAYNLVVADFGTYFVGKSRILVHDNTPIRDAPAKAK